MKTHSKWSFLAQLKEGLNAKSKGVSKVRAIVLDQIGVDSIYLGPAVTVIFDFEHDVGATLIIILIDNPMLMTSATPSLFYPKAMPQLC